MLDFIKNKNGNALIETAIMLPILLGLFMALIMFANAYRYKIVMDMAAKEGARMYQISMGDPSAAKNRAKDELVIGGVENAQVKITTEGDVEITKPYGFYAPIAGRYLLNLKSKHLFKQELAERYYGKDW